jgi:hypothetical protein
VTKYENLRILKTYSIKSEHSVSTWLKHDDEGGDGRNAISLKVKGMEGAKTVSMNTNVLVSAYVGLQ